MPTVRVSTSYGLTVPGDVPYSSQNYRIGFEVEQDMSQEAAQALLAVLSRDAKLAVINEARLTSGVDENGVVFPVFTKQGGEVTEQVASVTQLPTAAQAAAEGDPAPRPDPAPVQSQTNQGDSKNMTWDGRPVTVFDNRPKKASGEHKHNAADFRLLFRDVGDEAPDDVKYKGVWIKNKNGSVNQAGASLAVAYDA